MKSLLVWLFSYLPVFIAVGVLLGASVICSGCYTLKQGTTMLGYLGRAVPLEEIAKGNEVSEEDRLFVQRVGDIRHFAMEELGLKESKNYTRYVELDRNYLAAIVSASPEDSFGRFQWWFPVVGKVPYKGFFNVEDARKERAKLEKKGLDVWIRGVDAFSTLGWFRDPLYSYMKNYSEEDLSELIIHELLHATVYLKNQDQFNEELAQFVGTEGARLYMEKIHAEGFSEGEAITTAETVTTTEAATTADLAAYHAVLRDLIAQLDQVFKSGAAREEKLLRKAEIIERAKAGFDENYDSLFITQNYRFFSGLPVNNAYLELFRLYHEEDHYYKDLYERAGRDLRKFIEAAKSIGTNKKKGGVDSAGMGPKEELERALGLI